MAALIVEDGTGKADADTYISVSAADRYHDARGNTSWDTVSDKEAALRKATDYMLGRYRLRWAGQRTSLAQALDWPRQNVPVLDAPASYRQYYDNDFIPNAIKNACASLALRAASADLLADQSQQVLSVTVGPISTTYDGSSPQSNDYLEIEAMLRPFLKRTSNAISMVRV